jgi:hypothetical protein
VAWRGRGREARGAGRAGETRGAPPVGPVRLQRDSFADSATHGCRSRQEQARGGAHGWDSGACSATSVASLARAPATSRLALDTTCKAERAGGTSAAVRQTRRGRIHDATRRRSAPEGAIAPRARASPPHSPWPPCAPRSQPP